MEPKWTKVLVLLVFSQHVTCEGQRGPLKDGEAVDIECRPDDSGTMIVWFRVPDGGGMEFLGSFSNGVKKEDGKATSLFGYGKIKSHKVTLLSFSGRRDSGLYGCAGLVKGKELRFGPLTRLVGETVQQKPTVESTTPSPRPATTAPACACDGSGDGSRGLSGLGGLWLSCTPLILGPLLGGCGLLLLLLIVTILYCNRIRTRRCPHHYKRKPRAKSTGNK